jgi:signal transduction histidine kinase
VQEVVGIVYRYVCLDGASVMNNEARKTKKELLEEIERIRSRIAALEASEKQHKHLVQETRKERNLLNQMLAIYERDRQLVAYEIHDGLVQVAAGAMLQLQAFRERLDEDPQNAWQAFDAALNLLKQGIDEGRRLIHGLRPPVLEQSGVVTALENLILEQQVLGGLEVKFCHKLPSERLPSPLENAVFRIVQECLTNAIRHSSSREVRVRLTQEGNLVRVGVEDSGVGFDPKKVAPGCLGLEGIRQRARLLGGQALIDSKPGEGTRVTVDLPLTGGPRPRE